MTEFALEINNLQKVYDNNVVALKGIDLKVKKGDFYALLGPNGAGKSSTIGIIGSLVTKSGGTVSVFGNDIDRDSNKAKSLLGVVSQEINFSQFEKVLDIVVTQAGFYGIPKSVAMPKVESILKRLSLWDKRNFQARTLSGGYKRRLMIAKAIIHEPKLLILDEPTAGVDIELRREMWSFLKEINKNPPKKTKHSRAWCRDYWCRCTIPEAVGGPAAYSWRGCLGGDWSEKDAPALAVCLPHRHIRSARSAPW